MNKPICQISGLELPHRVTSLKELKKLASNQDGYAINISYSVSEIARSSKVVFYDPSDDLWDILHLTDDSEEQLSTSELLEFTHIGTALNKSSLYYEGC